MQLLLSTLILRFEFIIVNLLISFWSFTGIFFFFEKEKQGTVHNIITVKVLNISILQLIQTIFLHVHYSVCVFILNTLQLIYFSTFKCMLYPVVCKDYICRNSVKELVILFHRISAAPWGSRGIHYKNIYDWRFSLFLPLPPLLATGPFVAALDGKRIWYLLPARNQEWRMHMLS